jgi:hyperosmotically inducible periplasmic protein
MHTAPRECIVILAMLSAALVVACDRQDLDKYSAKAEAQIERAIPAIDDATITAKVKGALIAAPDLPGVAIDVDTSANVVTLNGTVASTEQRERAERTARAVQGVAGVNNNLLVKQ